MKKNVSNEKQIETRRDNALARALSTPHKPQKPLKAKAKKRKPLNDLNIE